MAKDQEKTGGLNSNWMWPWEKRFYRWWGIYLFGSAHSDPADNPYGGSLKTPYFNFWDWLRGKTSTADHKRNVIQRITDWLHGTQPKEDDESDPIPWLWILSGIFGMLLLITILIRRR